MEEMTTEQISEALDNLESANVTEPVNDTDNSVDVQDDSKPKENEDVGEDKQEAEEVQKEEKPRFNSLEEALKSYSELEKKLGQQGQELGELRKLAKQREEEQLEIAKNYGFENVDDFKNAQMEEKYSRQLAEFEANEYAKYLDRSEYPEEMRKLLLKYAQDGDEGTLELIEADMPLDVIKKVAVQKSLAQNEINQQKEKAQYQEIERSARDYLQENVNKYSDRFQNESFKQLYGEAFRAYGCDLNTEKFIELLDNYAESVINAKNIANGIHNENKQVTDEIAGIVNTNNAVNTPKDISKMSEKELTAYIRSVV